MKPKEDPKPDEALMRKHRLCWWWRTLGTRKWTVLSPPSKRGWETGTLGFKLFYERSAFLYELSARLTGKFEFEKPWPEIGRAAQEELANRSPLDDRCHPQRLPIYYGDESPTDNPPEGFSAFMGKTSFNLRLSNETLISAFGTWIDWERRRLGIPNPPPNKGEKRRGLSWRPLELLDIERLKLRPLEDAERSHLSKVRRSSKRVFNSASS